MDNKKCKPARFEFQLHPDQIQVWKQKAAEKNESLAAFIKSCVSAKIGADKK